MLHPARDHGAAGEQVEEEEKRGLPAQRHRDVFRAYGPAEFPTQHRGQGGNEGRISLRRVIVAEHGIKAGAVREQFAHAFAPARLDGRHSRRIATAQHQHVWPLG